MTLKSLIKRSTWALSTLGVLITVSSAKAYDEDTHFYGTYAMARYAGIRHEVASQIALSTQWMDESFISDPTSMIFLPILGIKKRRLFHFPSSRIVGTLATGTQRNVLGIDKLTEVQKSLIEEIGKNFNYQQTLDTIQLWTETTENHPFASEMLMQGLKQGNLMMASASLHTIEDSFAHAGTPAEQGHTVLWHWPDRPFEDMDKYRRMEQAVFSALVAIRSQLPAAALDCDLRLAPIPTDAANCKMDGATLAANYAATSLVDSTVSKNILQDDEYVATALRNILQRAVKVKYVNLNAGQIEQLIAGLPKGGTIDSYQGAEIIVKRLLDAQLTRKMNVMNIGYILSNMGRLRPGATAQEVMDYTASMGGADELIDFLSQELLKWSVPMPLSKSHRMELEDDTGPIRAKEIEIRVRNMQSLIQELFGTNIQMIPNPTKDEVGFQKEVLMDFSAETKIPVDSQKAYVTFSLKDRNEWDHMIFAYLFPSLERQDLVSMVQETIKLKVLNNHLAEYRSKRKAVNADKNLNLVTRKAALLKLDYQYRIFSSSAKMGKAIWDALELMKPMIPKMLADTGGTHVIPSEDNFAYRDPRKFEEYRRTGVIQQFLGAKDVWNLDVLKETARQQRN